MDRLFITRVLLSFLIAGSWITLATLAAERLGSKTGGLITNLPSNILISMIFIALTQGISFVKNAVPGIPIGMLINTVFLFVFIISLKSGLTISILFSLLTWFVLAVLATVVNYNRILPNILLYLSVTILTFIILEKRFRIPSVEKSIKKYSGWQILVRAIFAGGVVASVVLISQYFPPFFVGIFATFPAVLFSTMVILTVNQSREFARATGKVMVLASSNIVVYALAVYWTYPLYGIFWGTAISFFLASGWVASFRILLHKLS